MLRFKKGMFDSSLCEVVQSWTGCGYSMLVLVGAILGWPRRRGRSCYVAVMFADPPLEGGEIGKRSQLKKVSNVNKSHPCVSPVSLLTVAVEEKTVRT